MAVTKRPTAKAGKLAAASSRTASARVTKKASLPAARAKAAEATAVKPTAVKPTAVKPTAVKPTAVKKGAAAASPPVLGEGDRAPSFELPNQAGAAVSSASLSGRPYVLYFYPKDDTPGCTTQACGFRDSFPEFEKAGVRVLGVSPDSVTSHQKFVGKYGLPFTLLSDTDRALAAAYGVWALKKLYGRESMGIVRSTFLVGADGVIRKVWRGVRVNGHIGEVQSAAAALG